jgi:hypothetical protein
MYAIFLVLKTNFLRYCPFDVRANDNVPAVAVVSANAASLLGSLAVGGIPAVARTFTPFGIPVVANILVVDDVPSFADILAVTCNLAVPGALS